MKLKFCITPQMRLRCSCSVTVLLHFPALSCTLNGAPAQAKRLRSLKTQGHKNRHPAFLIRGCKARITPAANRQPVAPAPASASDVDGSPAECDLHTSVTLPFGIESRMWKCSRAAAVPF